MTISPETRASLRRLHAAYEAAWKPGEIIAEFDDVAELAVENLIPLLDALEAAEAERDRLREAARDMLSATFENGCSGHSDVAEQCPICRAHGRLSAALGEQP